MAWRIQDGFFAGSPTAIAQTQDGYIWIGTDSGLLRFDGARFIPWSSGNEPQLLSSEVRQLVAASDGSLWIATLGGLSRWKDRALTNYPSGPGGIISILEDSKRRIWFGENIATDGPLCEVVGTKTRCYGAADGVPSFRSASPLFEDRNGDLWFGCDGALARWNPRSHRVYQLAEQTARGSGITGLVSAPDGSLWVGVGSAGHSLGLEQLIEGRWKSFRTPSFDASTIQVATLYSDRGGALWIGTFDHGIYRICGDRVDHFASPNGLSGDYVKGFAEDREGNLWVATTAGVDRFADTPVIPLSAEEGLCSNEAASIVASRDGTIWVGGATALNHVGNGTVSCIRTGNGLPGRQVTSLLEDHMGRLWVGIDDGLWLYDRGIFRAVKRPDGSPTSMVMGIAEDSEKNVWITVAGPPRILMRVQDLVAREESQAPPKPRRVAADPTGGIWLGLLNGDLAHYHDGKQETYRFTHDSSALINQLVTDSDGSVLAATTYGLIGWHKSGPVTLTRKNGLPCENLNALTFDTEGNLWLFMECGLGEITSADLHLWLGNPNAKVSPKIFDALDGVRTGRPSFDGAARSPDGRLWFVNSRLLQTIDPAHLRRNPVPPPVHIEQVIADRKSYPVNGVVHLPPHTRDLEIDYVGLSFVAPQKVVFRYGLEGRDDTWQGTRRQAFYNDLRPGTYRFRVAARNNDGLWNEEGSSLDFEIAPAFYQTVWFQVSCAIAFLALLWGLHRLRLYQLAREFNVRLEERVLVSTRLARDLHDTLLQSFQGVLLRFQSVGKLLPEGSAKEQLEKTLERADQAIAEGRSAVYDLRSYAAAANDLAKAVNSLGNELSGEGAAAFHLVMEGSPRDLQPIVRDELYRISREALRNAFGHAHARNIEARISYGEREFRLRIRDDGDGIPAEILERGRPGHYGLSGIRERAQQVGAELTISNGSGAGTEVDCRLAGSIAYCNSRRRSHFRLFQKKVE